MICNLTGGCTDNSNPYSTDAGIAPMTLGDITGSASNPFNTGQAPAINAAVNAPTTTSLPSVGQTYATGDPGYPPAAFASPQTAGQTGSPFYGPPSPSSGPLGPGAASSPIGSTVNSAVCSVAGGVPILGNALGCSQGTGFFAWIGDLFGRAVVIVLGFIFVAAGLILLREKTVLREVTQAGRAVKAAV
jgi:hypothetical protein